MNTDRLIPMLRRKLPHHSGLKSGKNIAILGNKMKNGTFNLYVSDWGTTFGDFHICALFTSNAKKFTFLKKNSNGKAPNGPME